MADLVADYGLKVRAAFGAGPLGDLTGVWFDITTDVHELSTNRGRSGGFDMFDPGRAQLVLNNNSGKYDPTNELSIWQRTALDLPGASGDFASCSDPGSWSDLDIRVKVTADAYYPAAAQTLAAQWATSGNNRAWWFRLETTGKLRLYTSPDGATELSHTCDTGLFMADGYPYWVRVTCDVNDGAGNYVVKFYVSYDDGATWQQWGSTITTASTTSIYNSTAVLTIGAQGSSGQTNRFAGQIHRMLAFKAIGGGEADLVAAPRFDAGIGVGATSLTDSVGNSWTVSGAATIADAGSSTIVPFVPIEISLLDDVPDRYPIFTGFVQSQGVSLDYAPPNRSTTTFDCTDFMAFLSRYELPKLKRPANVGKTVSALISARVSAGLLPSPYVGWTIQTSDVPTQGYIGGESALAWLEKMVLTEGSPGFYVERDGSPTFLRRWAPALYSRHTTSQGTFGATGTDIRYGADGFEMDYATEIWNAATVSVAELTTEDNTDSTASDAFSIGQYGRSEWSADELASDPGPDPDALASWVVKAFKDPRATPRKMILYPTAGSASVWRSALRRRLMDRITVKFAAPGRTEESYSVFIERIEHQMSAADGSWTTTFEMSSAARYDFADIANWLELDDSTVGKLDTGKLGI